MTFVIRNNNNVILALKMDRKLALENNIALMTIRGQRCLLFPVGILKTFGNMLLCSK